MNSGGTGTELEQCLAIVAYCVVRHGDGYVPLLERLEQELATERARSGHRARAASILASLTREVQSA